MVSSILDIRVDVSRENNFQAILAKQYDKSTRFLRVTITDQGIPLVIEETCKVSFNIRRPDKEARSFGGSVNADGTLRIPLPAWGLALEGTCSCDISIYGIEGERLSTMGFKLVVKFSAVDEGNILENENYDILLPMLNALQIYENERREYWVVPCAETFYYDDFSDCIADINEGSSERQSGTSSSNVCCACQQDGVYTVTLLQNIKLTSKQIFSVDVILNLAGHVIDADLRGLGETISHNLFGFNCEHAMIHASIGGKIRLTGSNSSGIFNVSSTCKDFRILGGVYEMNCEASVSNHAVVKLYGGGACISNAELTLRKADSGISGSKTAYAIQATRCELKVENCILNVTDEGGGASIGIYCNYANMLCVTDGRIQAVATNKDSYGIYCVSTERLLIKGTPYIYADAVDNSVGLGKGCARAVMSRAKRLDIQGGTYIGTHSAVSLQAEGEGKSVAHICHAKLFSCGHGGFYATEDVTAFFEGCEIGWQAYTGIHDYPSMSNEGSGFYIGGTTNATNIAVYMDGCTLTGDAPTGHCGVLRGTSGEHDNKLYISNTTYPEGKKFRIDGQNFLYAGRGAAITDENAEQNDRSEVLEGSLTVTDDIYTENNVYTDEKVRGLQGILGGGGIINDAAGTVIHVKDGLAGPVADLCVNGATGQTGVPTPDAPQPILCLKQGSKVRIHKKNLLDPNSTPGTFGSYTGISFHKMLHGQVTVSIKLKEGKSVPSGAYLGLMYQTQSGAWASPTSGKWPVTNGTLTLTSGTFNADTYNTGDYQNLIFAVFQCTWEQAFDAFDIQLEEGSVATEYEPYCGDEVIAPCDLYEGDKWYPLTGAVERHTQIDRVGSCTLALTSIGNGAKAIVVSPKKRKYPNAASVTAATCADCSGNYANGQDGTYYQNVDNFVFVGTATDTLETLKAKYGDGRLLYRLATPATEQYEAQSVEFPEGIHGKATIDQFATELNGALYVKYRADTKLYIDNKFAELQAMLLQ